MYQFFIQIPRNQLVGVCRTKCKIEIDILGKDTLMTIHSCEGILLLQI